MPENITQPDLPIESASDTARMLPVSATSPVAEPEGAPAPPTLAPAATLAIALPSEMRAMLELVDRGLAPDADDATRAAARELWARCAQLIAAAASTSPPATAASAPVASAPLPIPTGPTMAPVPLPTSPIAMAARTLRQMSPDQLLELALQRLRAALPQGATVPAAKGIQFPLIPVPPQPGPR
jgi:hypothetical protein